MRIRRFLQGVCLLLWLMACDGLAQDQRAHVHGIGHMSVAIEGSRLEIEIEGPGDNFVGFERAAQTARQRAAIAAAERRLRRPATLLVLPPDAGCTQRDIDLQIPTNAPADAGKGHGHGGHGHDRDHDHGLNHDHGDHHDDWRVRYVFTCTAPAALASIRTAPWFVAFPGTRELRVQVISGFGQSGLTLTSARSSILLRTR
jgi:hypothetical protein